MNNEELSNKFDALISSFKANFIPSTENGDIAFNEYEKSVFLTLSQEATLIALYNGTFNNMSFESKEEARRYLAPLVLQKIESRSTAVPSIMDTDVWAYEVPEDVLVIIYESVDWDPNELGCKPWKNIPVIPVTHDEFHKIRKNPFRGTTDSRVLRLDSGITDDGTQYLELYSKHLIKKYKYRYLKKPDPIILEDLPEGITINGRSEETECLLHPFLINHILNNAVQMAINSKIGPNNKQQEN